MAETWVFYPPDEWQQPRPKILPSNAAQDPPRLQRRVPYSVFDLEPDVGRRLSPIAAFSTPTQLPAPLRRLWWVVEDDLQPGRPTDFAPFAPPVVSSPTRSNRLPPVEVPADDQRIIRPWFAPFATTQVFVPPRRLSVYSLWEETESNLFRRPWLAPLAPPVVGSPNRVRDKLPFLFEEPDLWTRPRAPWFGQFGPVAFPFPPAAKRLWDFTVSPDDQLGRRFGPAVFLGQVVFVPYRKPTLYSLWDTTTDDVLGRKPWFGKFATSPVGRPGPRHQYPLWLWDDPIQELFSNTPPLLTTSLVPFPIPVPPIHVGPTLGIIVHVYETALRNLTLPSSSFSIRTRGK